MILRHMGRVISVRKAALAQELLLASAPVVFVKTEKSRMSARNSDRRDEFIRSGANEKDPGHFAQGFLERFYSGTF
jgi:hypothetical protein